MQDLTHDPDTGGKAYLAPSSQNAGNTTADDPKLAMTAPGSTSVLPVPDRLDVLPLPVPSDGQPWGAGPMPVNNPPRLGEVASPHDGGFDRSEWQWNPETGGGWFDAPQVADAAGRRVE